MVVVAVIGVTAPGQMGEQWLVVCDRRTRLRPIDNRPICVRHSSSDRVGVFGCLVLVVCVDTLLKFHPTAV